MEGKKKKRKKRRLSFWYILGGGVLKEDFFIRHIKMILLVVVLTFGFISNRYSCILKIKKIDSLQKELNEVQLEALAISVELAGYSRPSMVEELVKKQHINLEGANRPPYELHR
ncbi:MAG: hypothetical protein LBS88_08345 [Tannerellaceae bacterium]|jgi:cell division protein FtsL|nr:hypothetical protein [Tannerellaceae bacterium]